MILTVVKHSNSFIRNLFSKIIFYIPMAEFEDKFGPFFFLIYEKYKKKIL